MSNLPIAQSSRSPAMRVVKFHFFFLSVEGLDACKVYRVHARCTRILLDVGDI